MRMDNRSAVARVVLELMLTPGAAGGNLVEGEGTFLYPDGGGYLAVHLSKFTVFVHPPKNAFFYKKVF